MSNCFYAVEISDVEVNFGQKRVIKGITLNVKRGESLAILGCSGSGKSVFIKSIVGLIPISKGFIKIFDQDVHHNAKYSAIKHDLGITFQHDALFDGMSVIDNLCFGLVHKNKLSVIESRRIAMEALGKMGFQSYIANLMPSELSGGMRKRIAVMRTIILNPKIAFFDEPTTGLDPINSDKVLDLMHEYIKNGHATSISITHSIYCANIIAENIAFIHDGKITWYGRKEDFKYSDNKNIQNFLKHQKHMLDS